MQRVGRRGPIATRHHGADRLAAGHVARRGIGDPTADASAEALGGTITVYNAQHEA